MADQDQAARRSPPELQPELQTQSHPSHAQLQPRSLSVSAPRPPPKRSMSPTFTKAIAIADYILDKVDTEEVTGEVAALTPERADAVLRARATLPSAPERASSPSKP